MKLSRFFTLATIALIAAVSCQKEDIVEPAGQKVIVSDNIVFSASSAVTGSETKAQYVGDMELTNEEGETITLTMSVMDNVESLPDQMSGTKGALIGTDNFTDIVKKIAVMGYLNASSDLYVGVNNGAETISQIGEHSDNNTYSTHWAPAHDYYWPKAHSLDFWAWAPMTEINAAINNTGTTGVKISPVVSGNPAINVENHPSSGNPSISFHYDLGNGYVSPTSKGTDATAMPDLIFANSTNVSQTTGVVNDGCVPLDFKHALAAIQFKVVSTKGAKINYIKLVDVAKEGACSFQNNTFAWDLGEPVKTSSYNHDFNANVTAGTESNFYASGSANADANFMMIPQKLGTQKIEISISIDANSAPEIFTGLIPSTGDIKAWQDGKIYVYTINIDENVNVNITDAIEGGIKKNVTMTNTGNVKAYLRAAIVANWVDGNGKIINAVWTPANGTWTAKKPDNTDATFIVDKTNNADPGTGWRLGSDGYYYYTKQVPPGESPTGTLFNTYTPGSCPNTGVDGQNAHLEMNIIVQAIQANMLIGTDGETFKTGTSAYGWQTGLLSTAVDGEPVPTK